MPKRQTMRPSAARNTRSGAMLAVAVFLSSGCRRGSCLDLRLDIAGGSCTNTSEFDNTFDDGVMPGTEEVMDITTTTLKEDATRAYGYSAFRGDDIANIDFQFHTELLNQIEAATSQVLNQYSPSHNPHSNQNPEGDDQRRLDMNLFECPVFKECPGAGDPTHWCAWICGYWQQNQMSSHNNPVEDQQRHGGGFRRFLRRVTDDLEVPDDDLAKLDAFEPIRYTPQDRQLWISIEGLVCGWIERWLDSAKSNCLHGAILNACELDLRG